MPKRLKKRVNIKIIGTARVAARLGLTILIYASSARALNIGPYNYYVVQNDIDVETTLPGSVRPTKLTLHRGQIVSLNQLTSLNEASLVVESKVNGESVEAKISFPASEIRKKFGPPLNPSNPKKLVDQFLAERTISTKDKKFLRLDDDPSTLGSNPPLPGNSGTRYVRESDFPRQTIDSGAQISVKESKIVNLGSDGQDRLVLVHNICLENSRFSQTCGWVRNELLSRGDPTDPKYNWYPSEVDRAASGQHAPCEQRDSLGRASQFAMSVKDGLKLLPATEQNARDAVRNAVDKCVTTAKMKTNSKDNLYQALAWPNASHEFDQLGSQASKVIVRGPDGKHPLSRQEFLAIDALARTLYGEMRENRCAEAPYLEATARVVINRALEPDPEKFRRFSGKAQNPILQSLLYKNAFSNWNNDSNVSAEVRANGRADLKGVLCPQRETSAASKLAWKRSLDIAMHAVLDENLFIDETKSLAGQFYFTSKRKSFDGFSPLPAPTLFQYKLNNYKCMSFWKRDAS